MREIKFRARSIEKQSWVYFGLDKVPSWVHPSEAEQFTGLKDKKGKEIYEWDIWKQGRSIGVIVFEEGQFIIDWRLYRDNWSNLLKFHWDVGQVIGNIYENADLLPEAIGSTEQA